MQLFEINQPVNLTISNETGNVVGYGQVSRNGEVHFAYLVTLDKGVWSEGRKSFIDVIVVDPDNIEPLGAYVSI